MRRWGGRKAQCGTARWDNPAASPHLLPAEDFTCHTKLPSIAFAYLGCQEIPLPQHIQRKQPESTSFCIRAAPVIFSDAIQCKQLDSLFIARSSVWKDNLCFCYYQNTRYITNPHYARSAMSWYDRGHGQAGHLQRSKQTENGALGTES